MEEEDLANMQPAGFNSTRQRTATTATTATTSSSISASPSMHHSRLSEALAMTTFACCRGFNARLLFLVGCAMIEIISHTVMLLLSPMMVLHFYPTTAFGRIGLYTALVSGSCHLGHVLSCRVWIQLAKTLNSSKGVILWGLAIIGTGFFSLLLCQSLLAMCLVRFATGLFSGVTPVALIQIDTICGHRQSSLAMAAKYVGITIGASLTFVLVLVGANVAHHQDTISANDVYFYPLGVVSMMAWIAVVVTLVGLRLRSRSSYMQVAADDDESPPTTSTQLSPATSPLKLKTEAKRSIAMVKTALEATFRPSKASKSSLLSAPNPHFRMIRSILPHYFHGYTDDGDIVVWDFIGQVKMDKLHSSGFTTVDLRDHYQFFLQFAVERLMKASTKFVYIIDLEGLTLTDADDRAIELATHVIGELQTLFPDRLSQLAVINAPVWFSQVMATVRTHIVSKKTIDKIVFFSRKDTVADDLHQLIGVDSLPRKYGGRNTVEMGKSSQERALDDLLKQTTGELEQTKVVLHRSRRARTNSVRSMTDGDDSDEEAFFDSLEYGLQDELEDELDHEEEEIAIVVHTPVEKVTARNLSSPPKPLKLEHPAPANDPLLSTDLAISREPHACLILAVLFVFATIQSSFDDLLPLWVFRHAPVLNGTNGTDATAISFQPTTSVSSLTLQLSAMVGVSAMGVGFCRLLFAMVSSSGNLLTPLATLRLGLLVQLPVLAAFPLVRQLPLSQWTTAVPLEWICVTLLTLLKHVTSSIALHGLLQLLDNSIALDRRLALQRASYLVKNTASCVAGGVSPALFALLVLFGKSFPFDPSLLYFVMTLGSGFLLLFSFLLPSRLNFPQLFALGKR